ncbi:MAG: AlpA family phage regulatory protein [Rhizobiaceae bacterium]|nr:AlpA family phage regulatory protein [Rhizobiaceae bacterium]
MHESKKLLTRVDLKALGIWQSNTTLLRLEAAGRFPRRIRIGGTAVAWIAEEIFQWIEACADARSKHHYADSF